MSLVDLDNNIREKTHKKEAEAFFFFLSNVTITIHKRGVYPISLTLEYMVHSVNPNHTYVET